MAPQFEPLQNDLIIRTAWGKIPSINDRIEKVNILINIMSIGQKVERVPMWGMGLWTFFCYPLSRVLLSNIP
jgi:hypothetical protein